MQNLDPEFLFHCQEAMARLCDVVGDQSFDKGKELCCCISRSNGELRKSEHRE